MAAPRDSSSSPGRIPALGFRLLALIIISILLMFFDHRDQHLDTVRSAIGAAVYPVRVLVDAPVRFWNWTGESLRSRNELQLELQNLKREAQFTRVRLQQLAALEAENARLKAMLGAREQVRDRTRVAEIMSVDANPYNHSLVLNVGTRDGASDGQALVDANGVVGQIIEAGLMTSQAMLISDTDHALPVEVNRNGLRTIVVGTGSIDRLDLPFVVNNADIDVGDLLVTSGLGGAFPAGYPVAIVSSVTRIPQEPYAMVSATPSASLGQVREVLLILSQQQTAEGSDD